DRAIANREMASRAYLAGKNATVADFCGSRQTNLPAKHRVCSDPRGVADQNKVVEFGAAADARFPNRGTVDAGVGLNFHIVFEHGRARLRHLVPGAVFLFGEAQTVAADDDAVLQDYAVANAAVFANDCVGVGEEVIADSNTAIERDETVKHGVPT